MTLLLYQNKNRHYGRLIGVSISLLNYAINVIVKAEQFNDLLRSLIGFKFQHHVKLKSLRRSQAQKLFELVGI